MLTWSDIPVSTALGALLFTQNGRHINPSRASPLNANSGPFLGDGGKRIINVGKNPAIFVSCIYVVASYIYALPENGYKQHSVQGVLHQVDMERFEAFSCMLMHKEKLYAALERDSMTFSSRAVSKGSDPACPVVAASDCLV